MWCQWVKSYLLKRKSFWEIKMPSNPSWVWRKMLNLRTIVHPHIKTIIGNGLTASLWFDNWHPLGPLAERFGSRVIYDSGLPSDSTVSTIIRNFQWALPITQTLELNEIRANMSSLAEPNRANDSHKWMLTSNGQFSIASLCNHLRTQFPKVLWHHSLWFSGHIPKCSLIVWIAVQNRLYTEDRLVTFGTKSHSCCSFCQGHESHDHLFFNCPFTSHVWSQITGLLNEAWPSKSWSSWVSFISSFKGKSLKTLMIKLAFTTSIYHLWIERNLRKFQNVFCSEQVVVHKIYSLMRLRLMSLKDLPQGHHAQGIIRKWNLIS